MLTREQYFPGQGPREQIALFIRRHQISFLPWTVASIFLVVTTIFASISLLLNPGLISGPETIGLARGSVVIVTAVILLGLMFYFLRAWMSYYLDITIVTERRLVDIQQEGIFSRKIAEQSLFRVQDVSAKQRGFIQHLFNFGTLYIETAGEQPNFELINIPRPNEVAKTILNLHDRLVGNIAHDIEISVAQARPVDIVEIDDGKTEKRHRHPLEDLRPYFPEPGHHHAPKPTVPKEQTNHREPGEGRLQEGETVKFTR